MNTSMMFMPFVLAGALLLTAAWGVEKAEVFQTAADKSGVQKIEMVAGEYYFKPNRVIVKVNKPVEILIRKEAGFPAHSIVLHAAEAGIDFAADLATDAQAITFTPAKAGKFAFYCDKGLLEKHRDKGMEGVLEVTE